MIVERCSDQKSKSLDAFYGEIAAQEDVSRDGGSAMLELLTALRAHADQRRIWGLTSLYRLCLLSEDTWKSPWYVIVAALDRRNFYVEYLMPESVAPWPRAYVKGEARSVDQALQMVLAAMRESKGWSSFPEKG